MPQFICAFYPKKSAMANGAVAIATCLEAKNNKLAEMKATMALEESFPDTSDNFFKPKISEYVIGDSGRPAVGSFDTEWIVNYEWNEDTKKFDYAPKDLPGDTTDRLSDARVIYDLPIGERIAYIVMYGATPDVIDPEHLSNAVDMFVDDETPEEIRIMIDGMLKVPSINAMLPSSVAEIIDLIRAVMPPVESAEEVAKLAIGHAKKPAERGEHVERNKSGISRSYDLLDTEAALHVMGIRPSAAKASDLRNAKYLKDDRDATWRAWSTEYRIIPDILNIDSDELFDLMIAGHKDLKLNKDADARRQYVSGKLRGHPLLPNYPIEDQPKIENLGNAKFSIEGLTAGDETTRSEPEPSIKRNEYTNAVHVAIARVISGELPKIITREEIQTIIPGDLEENGGAGVVADILKCIVNTDKNSSLGKGEVTQLTAAILRAYVDNNLFDEDNLESFVAAWLRGDATPKPDSKPTEKPLATVTTIDTNLTKTDTKPLKTDTETIKPAPETSKSVPKSANSEKRDSTAIPAQSESAPDDFKTRAEILEKELADKTGDAATNLSIWKRVQRTDPARTKQQNTTNAKGEITRTVTSIRPTYQYMRATEIFGPFGIGWGVDVVEERFDRGLPMMESVLDNSGREIAKKVMRDGDGTIMTSLNHTMRIILWYIHGGVRGEITAYGHTKSLYTSKYGFTVEDEPSKKSLTDATTKALSSLGFSADVYLGLFDDAEYTAENAYEHNLKNASEKAEDAVRVREELDERFAKNTETMRNAISASEVTKIASSLTRTIGSEIKTAKRANDTGHVTYLESRLRRLEEIKSECLTKFEGEKA